MANKLDKVFKTMEKNGWKFNGVKKQVYLNHHLSSLEKCFVDYHYQNINELKETIVDSIGFITDFVNALKEVSYGK